MKTNDLILIVLIYILFSFKYVFSDRVGSLHMEIWDVGQGDAIYISTPGNRVIIVDGGDNFEVDYKISRLMPFYSCYIDFLVLTHPHYDHINGLNRLLQRCEVGTLIFNDVDFNSSQFFYFKNFAEKNNVKNVFAGDSFEVDGVTFKILWPTKEFLEKSISDINDVSIVIFLDYGDFEALLTGDATDKVLGNIDYDEIANLVDGDFDVLKVPHHGSKYSLHRDFYSKLKPKDCVVSVGKNNRFGHPSPLVMEYFEKTGCRVLRTDELGDIKYKVY